ncbi:unnamed protein product, partial [marine sediment metagenome]
MEKILLNKHENQSEGVINGFYKFLSGINELIVKYNSLPLKNLETETEVNKFLSNPMDYLDSAIQTELKLTISPASIKPRSPEIGKLFGIDYYGFNRKVEGTPGLAILQHFKWDANTKKLEMSPSEILQIRESYYQFTESDAEVRAVREIRQLCVHLNKHLKKYKNQIIFPNCDLIARELG